MTEYAAREGATGWNKISNSSSETSFLLQKTQGYSNHGSSLASTLFISCGDCNDTKKGVAVRRVSLLLFISLPLAALRHRVEHAPFAGSVEVKQGLVDGWEYGSCFCSLDFLPSYGTHAATHPQQRLRWCGKPTVQAVICRQEQRKQHHVLESYRPAPAPIPSTLHNHHLNSSFPPTIPNTDLASQTDIPHTQTRTPKK